MGIMDISIYSVLCLLYLFAAAATVLIVVVVVVAIIIIIIVFVFVIIYHLSFIIIIVVPLDINECLYWNLFKCKSDKFEVCVNTRGSYKCDCQQRLYLINGSCQGWWDIRRWPVGISVAK